MSRVKYIHPVLIYKNTETNVSVFKAVATPGSVEVVLKEQIHETIDSMNHAIEEAVNQARLNHPGVVPIYTCRLELVPPSRYKTVIVEEPMEGSLYEEIEKRRLERRPWTEGELLKMFKDMTSALTFAETLGISHRDIKPQNVFVKAGILKFGDFGSSTITNFETFQKTIQGSPYFLSPELKRLYAAMLGNPNVEVSYQAFKSDVYSLALTFVFMIQLKPPEEFCGLDALKANTAAVLSRLPVSSGLKYLLELMLNEDPYQRGSFSDIDAMLQTHLSQFDKTTDVQQPDCSPEVQRLEESKYEVKKQSVPEMALIPTQPVSEPSRVAEESKVPEAIITPKKKKPVKEKRCMGCMKTLPASFSLTDENLQGHFSKVASFFCSEKCVENFSKICKYETCVNCNTGLLERGGKRGEQQKAIQKCFVTLPCLHMFHKIKCFKVFLCKATSSLTQRVEVKCPRCQTILPPSFVEELLGRKKLSDWVKDLHNNVCRQCGKSEGRTLEMEGCGHKFCPDCKSGNNGRCSFCRRIEN